MKRLRDENARNVTLSLPVDLLKKIKIIAAQRDTSISQLLRDSLETLVETDQAYHAAKERSMRRLQAGFDMGSVAEKYQWSRGSLHER